MHQALDAYSISEPGERVLVSSALGHDGIGGLRENCVQDKRVRVTDEEFNRIFELNHGAEAQEYYELQPPTGSSQWRAVIDQINGCGRGRHVSPNGGAE